MMLSFSADLSQYAREFDPDSDTTVDLDASQRPPLDVDFEEFHLDAPAEITYLQAHAHAHSFEEARELFIKGNNACEQALKIYILDGYVSEHVRLKQVRHMRPLVYAVP
jgi:hypothetical protein